MPFTTQELMTLMGTPQGRALVAQDLAATGADPHTTAKSMMDNPAIQGIPDPTVAPIAPFAESGGGQMTPNTAPQEGSPGGAGPWSFVYGATPQEQQAGGAMMAAAPAEGGMAASNSGAVMPGHGMDWRKVMEGAAGLGTEAPKPVGATPIAQMHWDPFKAELARSAAMQHPGSLAQIIGR